MKKFLLALVVVGIGNVLKGQAPFRPDTSQASAPRKVEIPTSHGKGKIEGVVKDSLTKEGIEFATVALIRQETGKIVDGAVCDEKGSFELSKLENGSYRLEVAFMGYRKKTIQSFQLTDEQHQLSIDTIALAPTIQSLQEVTVEGEKTLFEDKVDRVVYNAENDATNKGGDATDVLRKAPMLSVDLDGNVSIRGSQNVRVLVNNKPSAIMATNLADALKQIPADQIKSVEVITSPSAKYDAEGSGGIINIILKKNTLEGFSLGIDASGGYRGSNLGLNGSYKKGKMGLSLGGHGRAGYNINGRFDNSQTTHTTDGTALRNTQQADTRNQMGMGHYTLGWDYDINKNNSLTSSIKYSFRNNSSFQDYLLTQSYRSDSLLNSSTRDVFTNDQSGTIDLSLNYTHTFAKPQKEFSILTLYSRNNRINDFNNTVLSNADLSVTDARFKNQNKSFNEEVTVQADYQTPIGNTQLFEMGAKNIVRKVESNYAFFTALGADGPYLPSLNRNQNNSFSYNQNVTASYLSHTVSFLNTYTAKAGVRYEYTAIKADFRNSQSETTIPSYGVLVPSLNVSKKLNKSSTLKASYSRRIQRPSIQFLNPNLQAANPLNATIGNPTLNPEYSNNYELAYSMFTKLGSFNVTGFMRNTRQAIQSVRNVLGDTILTTYQNIGSEDAYGLNLFANAKLSNAFSLNGGVDVFYAVLRNNVPDPLYRASNEGWVANYRMMASYKLPREWALQFFGFYRAREVQLQGFRGGFGIYSLSMNKSFKDKKGSIGFGLENFFTPAFYIRSSVHSPVIDQQSTNELHNFNFKINLSYRIGKLTTGEERKKKRKSVNNDDMKEGGDNSMQGGAAAPSLAPASGGAGEARPTAPQRSPNPKP